MFALIEGSRIARPRKRRLLVRDSLRRGVFEHSTNSSVDRRIELNFRKRPDRQCLTGAREPAEIGIWQNMDMR